MSELSSSEPEEDLSPNLVLADVEKQIKTVCKLLQRQASRLHEEQKSFDAMTKKMESMAFSSTVKLNVGGHHFTTTIQTLTKDPNSMLAAMFSGRFEMTASKDGTFFIDRDGTYFRLILNYLRDGKLSLPEGATFLEEIAAEAEFYQIQGILDELKGPRPTSRSKQERNASTPFDESEIMTYEHRKMLQEMLPYRSDTKWRLLYRASRDGFEAANFHSKCDNKGPTVTIVKSGSFVFGGFTEVSWESPGPDYQLRNVKSKEAFLFSLVNPYEAGGIKIGQIADVFGSGGPQGSITNDSTHGPAFGLRRNGRYDLQIASSAHESRSSHSYLGNSYECPKDKGGDLIMTGANEFIVTDYEVFELY